MTKTDEMMNNPLVSLGLIKEAVGNILMTDDDVSELVMPYMDNDDYSFEDNWFGSKIGEDINGQMKDSRLLGHCKLVPYIDETITDTRTLILMETYPYISTSIIDYTLVLNIVCHRDVVELDDDKKSEWKKKGYAGNRIDMVAQAINKALTDESVIDNFGIGKMELDTRVSQGQSFKPNTNFYGRTFVYRVDEINMELLSK